MTDKPPDHLITPKGTNIIGKWRKCASCDIYISCPYAYCKSCFKKNTGANLPDVKEWKDEQIYIVSYLTSIMPQWIEKKRDDDFAFKNFPWKVTTGSVCSDFRTFEEADEFNKKVKL